MPSGSCAARPVARAGNSLRAAERYIGAAARILLMDQLRVARAVVGAGIVALLGGCSSAHEQTAAPGGSAGSGGNGGSGGMDGGELSGASATGSAAGGAGGESLASCPGAAPTPLSATTRLDLPVRVTINAVPAVVGETGVAKNGREFRLSLFKFFLSQPTLLDAEGKETKAQFVNEAGTPEPYELHLIDLDDAGTQLLHLATAPGKYTSLRFGVGVPAACNVMNSTSQVYPLNPDSEMFWDWASRFIFIRIEGSSRPNATAEWQPFLYHVGFDPAFITLTIPGAIDVGTGAAAPTLSLDIDRMLETDAGTLPSPKHSVPDGWVVDNLEENQAFTLQ